MTSKNAVALAISSIQKRWVVFGVVLWLVFVISSFPASWGAFFLTRSGDLGLSGVTGTLWSGKASLASIKMKGVDHALGSLTWKLDALSLFTFKPCAKISTNLDNQQFDGIFCVGGQGSMSIAKANGIFSASLLQSLLPLPIDGQATAQLDVLKIKNNQIAELKGKLNWMDTKIYNGANWMPLGSIGFDLVDDQKFGVKAHVYDVKSPLHLNVDVVFLAPTGGSVKGSVTMTNAFVQESNATAWMSMFSTASAPDDQGNIVYAVDFSL